MSHVKSLHVIFCEPFFFLCNQYIYYNGFLKYRTPSHRYPSLAKTLVKLGHKFLSNATSTPLDQISCSSRQKDPKACLKRPVSLRFRHCFLLCGMGSGRVKWGAHVYESARWGYMGMWVVDELFLCEMIFRLTRPTHLRCLRCPPLYHLRIMFLLNVTLWIHNFEEDDFVQTRSCFAVVILEAYSATWVFLPAKNVRGLLAASIPLIPNPFLFRKEFAASSQIASSFNQNYTCAPCKYKHTRVPTCVWDLTISMTLFRKLAAPEIIFLTCFPTNFPGTLSLPKSAGTFHKSFSCIGSCGL